MKKKFFLLLFAIILVIGALFLTAMSPSTLAFAANLPTKATFFKAIVTANHLNVRTGPTTNSSIAGVLSNGDNVEVYGKVGDWYIVYHPTKKCVGMVYGQYVKTAGEGVGSTSTTDPFAQLQNAIPKVITIPVPQSGSGNIKIPVPTTGTKQPSGGGQTGTKTPITSPTPSQPSTSGSVKATAEETELLGYVNQARKTAGVSALQFDDNVLKTARLKARDMVEKNYFSHQSPTYGSPFDMMGQYGITFKTAGENIAGNSGIRGAFDAWMKSAGHKKNILSGGYNLCGFGIEPSSVYGKVLVQQFIGR